MSLHIGHEIKRKYKESGMKLSEFAERLNTSPRNIQGIFGKGEINTDQLQKICEILNFNFFALYQPAGVIIEPGLEYASRQKRNTLEVSVVLDGQEETLNQWVERLTEINALLTKNQL